MTHILTNLRETYGSNMPMPYVITPDSVENKYSGNVDIEGKVIQFPEAVVEPFEWGTKKCMFGRESKR